jgi:hypothetical protein
MMPRRTNPEILLGLLLASLFWIVVLGWQASYFPRSQQANDCYETAKKAGTKTDDCKGFWERTTSDPTAAFTLGIFIFNIVLRLSTVALWQVTRRSTDIAERAFSDLERPYVYIFGAKGLERESERMDPYDFLKYQSPTTVRHPPTSKAIASESALASRRRHRFRWANGTGLGPCRS